jgi:hypothetical protein
MDGESRPWSCSSPSSRMSVRPELIMRLGSLREIILRGTLRGRMLAVSVEQASDRDAVAGIGKARLGVVPSAGRHGARAAAMRVPPGLCGGQAG